jgi:hypothetical protein
MTPDLSEDLKRVIDQYLEGHRTRSLATLSRISGVAYTTLRRFAQKEGNPTAEPVLKILDATLPTKEKIAFLERHFPEIARTISRYSGRSFEESGDPGREDLKMFFRRDPHNFVLGLAINVKGTTVEAIRRLCGERGLAALDEMVECQVLDRDMSTGRVKYRDDTLISVDTDFLLNQIRRSADYFDQGLVGTRAARIGFATAAVNREGLERAHRIVSDALNEISAVHEDPRYHGDIPYFVGTLMNVYDKAPLAPSLGDSEDQ